MENITTKEYAEIRNCSETYINRLVRQGKVKSIQILTEKKVKKNLIPLDQLSIEEQRKYYEKKGILNTEIQVKNADILEELTAEEREECALWERILKEWRIYRERPYFKSKAKADEMFIERVRDELPNLSISEDILFRKYKRLVNGDLKGLIDNRGKAKKGCTKIDETVWQVFLSFYLDQAQHPVRKCVKRTEEYVKDKFPELAADIPAYCTFIRHVNSDISDAIVTLGREGEKAFDDRCAPYIRRVYDNMESNDYWIGDNHTIDVLVGDGEKTFRLYLTAFMDARSGVVTGIYLTDAPCAQASIYSLKRGIQKYGIPKNLYLDNGREFLTRDFGGLGHRKKKNDADKFTPPPILQRLGIKMVNAEVRNAKAKTIERRFLDFKNSISRLFSTYTGGNVVEKPEILKVELKKGNIPDKQVFIKEIEEMIEYYMNYEEYNGAVVADRGLRKIDVYQKNLHTLITATDDQLNLMMMRSIRPQKVTRRGVHLDINGARIDYFDNELIMQMLNKQVYFRYDPDDLSKIRIYDLDDRYIMEVKADNTAVLEYGATKEDVKAAMAKTRSFKKAVKEAIKGSIIANIDRNTALELVLKQVEENKKSEIAQANIDLKAIKTAEEQALLYQMPSVDLDKMNENAIKRQGGKDYA